MRTGSAVSATAALLLAACSGDTNSRVTAPSSTPGARAAAIAIVSGDNQQAKAGEQLSQPLVVRVTDVRRRSVEGAAVSFSISGSGGLNGKQAPGPSRLTTQTNADGVADVTLEPYDAGPISVTARLEGKSSCPSNIYRQRVGCRRPTPLTDWGWSVRGVLRSVPMQPHDQQLDRASRDHCRVGDTGPNLLQNHVRVESCSGSRVRQQHSGTQQPVSVRSHGSGTWEYEDRVSGLRATLTAK